MKSYPRSGFIFHALKKIYRRVFVCWISVLAGILGFTVVGCGNIKKLDRLWTDLFFEKILVEKHTDTVRLAIPNFRQLNGDQRYKALERALPEILAAGLIDNKRIAYVGHSVFWRLATNRLSVAKYKKNPDIIFSDEFFDALGIDLVLRGTFFEYRGKMRLEAQLEDRRNQSTINISSKVVDAREILSGIIDLTRLLKAEITAIDQKKASRKIAILCFQDNSMRKAIEHENIGKNLAVSLIANLELKEGLVVLPWSKTRNACDVDRSNPKKLLESLEAEALITGNITIESNRITISPLLFFKGTSDYVDLYPIQGSLSTYFKVEENLTDHVRNILESVASPAVGWNIDVLQERPRDKTFYLDKGKKLMQRQDSQSLALIMFQRALEIDHNDSEAQYYLGVIKFQQNRFFEAIEEFKRTLEIDPKNAGAQNKLGDTYLEINNYRMALKAYQNLLQLNSNLADIHFKIGKVGFLLKNYPLAIEQLELAKDDTPENAEIWLLLADAYAAQGDNGKALDIYRYVGATYPEDEPTLNSLFNRYLEKGRQFVKTEQAAMALEYFEAARQIRPTPSIHAIMIELYGREKKYDQAAKILEASEDLKIIDADICHNFGWVAYDMNDLDLALLYFEMAIKFNPEDATFHNSKGWVLDKLGRIKEGIAAYSRAIELDPKDIRAYNNKAYDLNLLGRYKEAIKMADQAIAILPTYANPYVQKGYSLHRLGRTTDAVDSIQKAIQINPDLSGAYFNLAIIDAEQNNTQAAVGNLQIAIQINKTLKEKAIDHPSFENLKEIPQFQELMRN